jgi:3-phenylpropionate/trans-cinnamate dioxygenase ferredoxin reductase subunit
VASIRRVVVVGSGRAGIRTAEALRKRGFDGSITVLGAESELPYDRPPLSKEFLQKRKTRDEVLLHPASWYGENDVELRLGTEVEEIDRDAAELVLPDGERVPFDALVLATGSTPRTLDVPGADHDGVHYLRRLDDSESLRQALDTGSRLAIIGGGWIGLECAAAGRRAGLDVTLLEAESLPLGKVLGLEMAQLFVDLHREKGVDIRTGVKVESLETHGDRITGVELADGEVVEADVVLVGVGIAPNTGLAEKAGLDVDNGIVVDEHLRTVDPRIWAVGDVANATRPPLGRRLRVEHWAEADRQPDAAAASIVGDGDPYDARPFFFSDQYDLGMEYRGFAGSDDYDRVVVREKDRADETEKRELLAFWVKDAKVLAAMNVNVWDVEDDVEALLARDEPVDLQRLADPDVPLGKV